MSDSSSNTTWRVEEVSRNVHNIRIVSGKTDGNGWSQRVFLSSDWHWDNPHCQRAKLKKHLDEALRLNAPVIVYGDLFCAMQGKFDRRSSKNDIRPEHANGDYFDSLVSTAAEWLRPYLSILAVISPGNHETAVLSHHETNLTERLVERLRSMGSLACAGGYSGYVRFMVDGTGGRSSTRLHYHHGWGGGGHVTRGVIGTNRKAAYISDADVCVGGHVHEEWIVPISRIRLNNSGRIEHVRQFHICTPGYKEEFQDGYGGYHIEKGRPPKPTGSAWLMLMGSGSKSDIELNAQLTT